MARVGCGDERPAATGVAARRQAGAELVEKIPLVVEAARAMARRFQRGGKLVAFGTGLCAADAQHVAVEFVHPVIVGTRALPALSLVNDLTTVTGMAADAGPGEVFAYELQHLAQEEDIALGISADAHSISVLRGLSVAARMGLLTVALVGGKGDTIAASPTIEHLIEVPSVDPLTVKELQVTAYHLLWEVTQMFLEEPASLEPGAAG